MTRATKAPLNCGVMLLLHLNHDLETLRQPQILKNSRGCQPRGKGNDRHHCSIDRGSRQPNLEGFETMHQKFLTAMIAQISSNVPNSCNTFFNAC